MSGYFLARPYFVIKSGLRVHVSHSAIPYWLKVEEWSQAVKYGYVRWRDIFLVNIFCGPYYPRRFAISLPQYQRKAE